MQMLLGVNLLLNTVSRRWFQIFFWCSPPIGENDLLTNILRLWVETTKEFFNLKQKHEEFTKSLSLPETNAKKSLNMYLEEVY